LTRSRRAELFAAGVLSPTPGVSDRRRLTIAISFASTSDCGEGFDRRAQRGSVGARDLSQAVWLA
jgi:hypothetical protein